MPNAPEVNIGYTVLLIDDEEMVRRTLKSMLTIQGFKVLEAEDGFSAIELFLQNKEEISFVICDLMMPSMTGWETLANLKRLSADIPLILSSGFFDPKIMSSDIFEGPHIYLKKPVTFEEFIAAINQVMQCQRNDGVFKR
jgi:two-component system, cell cycle sensor histidine kinase and response regulator CckA